ncbi:MAG: FitA-like ribbon-helix-helix domain-containing protein [Burkholderiales bacterium]
MAALLIKDLPPKLHQRLKAEARRQRRSMTQHALALLEQGLEAVPRRTADLLGPPIRTLKPIPPEDIVRAIRSARDIASPAVTRLRRRQRRAGR